jgi:hypothetical protein
MSLPHAPSGFGADAWGASAAAARWLAGAMDVSLALARAMGRPPKSGLADSLSVRAKPRKVVTKIALIFDAGRFKTSPSTS